VADAILIDGVLAAPGRAGRRLCLEEVLEAGLPAVYQRYGERLLYLEGRIFDASDPGALAEVAVIAAGAVSEAVGLEFGWQHAADCSCAFCSVEPTTGGLTVAVTAGQRPSDEELAS
jgi:hypothetical protein